MNVNQKITRDQVMFLTMAAIGLIALFLGFVLNIEKDVMLGISCGFIPTGIGGWFIYLYARNNKQMRRNIEIEIDERNQFIGYKAAYTSFWIIYWYVCILTMFAKYITISLWKLGTFTLILMALIYFSARFLYSRKY